MSDRIPIDRSAEVKEDLPAYLFFAGWGDGFDILHSGAHIYLSHQQGNQVYFYPGYGRPTPGSVQEGYGGFFELDHLSKLAYIPTIAEAD